MNTFMNGLKNASNYAVTENGAVTHKSTRSDLLDMFAMGAAMRTRSNEDVILMFRKAFAENPIYVPQGICRKSCICSEVSVLYPRRAWWSG